MNAIGLTNCCVHGTTFVFVMLMIGRMAPPINYKCKRPRSWKSRYLYKYGRLEKPEHLNWLEGIILRNEVYIPSPPELNDPREARPRFVRASLEAFKKMIFKGFLAAYPGLTPDQQREHWQVIDHNLSRFGVDWAHSRSQEVFHEQLLNQRIYSLSKRPNNLHLWNMYAINHSGYCLQFRRKAQFVDPKEVRYRARVEFEITAEQITGAFYFYKRPKWRKEEELRIVGKRSDLALITIDPSLLTGIILGRRILLEHDRKIREWAETRMPNIPVSSASTLILV